MSESDPYTSMAYRVRQGRKFVTPPAGLSYTGSYVIEIFLDEPQLKSLYQILVPAGSPGRGKLCSITCVREGVGRLILATRRSRVKRLLHVSLASWKFSGGSLLSCLVSFLPIWQPHK